MKKKIISIVMLIALISSLVVMSGCGKKGEKVIKIGLAGPLSGNQSITGQDMFRGAKLAVDELNKKGGILNKKIELLVYDDKALGKEAVTVANLLSTDKDVLAVIGHLNSSCSKAALPVYNKNNIPMVTPVSTDDGLSRMGFNNFFRIPLKNSMQGRYAAEYAISNMHLKRFYVVDDGTAYGKGIADEFIKSAKELGGLIVGRDQVSESVRDFRQLLSKISNEDIDLMYLGLMYPQAGPLVKQAKEMKLQIRFMGGDGLFGEKLLEFPTDGVYVTFIAPLEAKNTKQKQFFENYKNTFNEQVNSYAPLAYDAVMVVAKAISEIGKSEKINLINQLHSGDFEYSGITGNIKFDENGDSINRKAFLYKVVNNEFVLIE